MSIESTSSATAAQVPGVVQGPGAFGKLKDLAQALESGDLAGARKAFGSLQQIQNGRLAAPDEDDSALRAAFARVGIALQSGDVKGAKDSLATLKQAARKAHGPHHHHGTAKPRDATPTASASKAVHAGKTALGELGQSINAIA
jgi:hypothetical protein